MKADKSLEEVWEMKYAAYKKFLNSEFENYAEYLNFREKQIDEKMNNELDVKINHIKN